MNVFHMSILVRLVTKRRCTNSVRKTNPFVRFFMSPQIIFSCKRRRAVFTVKHFKIIKFPKNI